MDQRRFLRTVQQTCPQNIHHLKGQFIHRLELFVGSIEL